MRAQSILTAMLLIGCGDKDTNTDSGVVVDTGGLTVDDDCFLDGDGDGYGDPGAAGDCAADGYIADSTDCDDNDDDINPGADELCDGVDNNCSGDADGADAIDAVAYYPDSDSDGYGDDASKIFACEAPAGALSEGGDCDDSSADINPGAEEACYDGVDSNCDGGDNLTGCSISLADADVILAGSDALDVAGFSIAPAGDLNADGIDDILVGARLEDSGGTDAGVAYAVFGPVVSMALDDADVLLTGSAGEYAGISVVGDADFNGDGQEDVLVGALNTVNAAGGESGAAYVVYGPVSSMSMALADADVTLMGTGDGYEAGRVTAALRDLNGDGLDELLVGARLNDDVATDAGMAYLLYGGVTSGDLDTAGVSLMGVAAGDRAGSSVADAGDVDGDGVRDVLIGAYRADGLSGEDNVGVNYLLLGGGALAGAKAGGSLSLADADATFYGAYEKDQSGEGLSTAGDINGDGLDDILIGTQYFDDSPGDDSGVVYVMLGGALSGDVSVNTAYATLVGENAEDAVGRSVATVGDLNDDGLADVLVGAKEVDQGGDNAGAAYLFLGPVSGERFMSEANGAYIGNIAGTQTGTAVASAGDVNNDGELDLMMGGPSADGGYIHIVFGGSW